MPGLYPDRIKALARRAREGRALDGEAPSASRKNPMCGDEVTVFAKVGSGGRAEVGYRVRGCLLCQASCERMAELAEADPDSGRLRDLAHAVESMFDNSVPPEMEEFAAARAHRSRHECVLMPFRALAELLGCER